MATLAKRPAEAVGIERRRTAFGLTLSIDQRISIPGLGNGGGALTAEPPSRVLLDEGELERRWAASSGTRLRARELRFDETLVLSVDYEESVGYLMWALGYGRVLISPDGLELLCEPDPANEDWASILAAQALPLAATIRGMEVMHASGVVLEGRAVLFAGPPGAGKSSLAAALIREGGQLLSDDAVALHLDHGRIRAHAGSVVLQLREPEYERLCAQGHVSFGRAVSSSTGRRRYVSESVPDAAPLAALFLLGRSSDQPAIEPLPAVNPFELIGSTFNLSVRTPARLRRQLDVASMIASKGLAYRLRVQPDVDATRLARMIHKHSDWRKARLPAS